MTQSLAKKPLGDTPDAVVQRRSACVLRAICCAHASAFSRNLRPANGLVGERGDSSSRIPRAPLRLDRADFELVALTAYGVAGAQAGIEKWLGCPTPPLVRV